MLKRQIFRLVLSERTFNLNFYKNVKIVETGRRYIININVPVVYMMRDIMILMREISITRAIGKGWPWNPDFLGPEMATNERSECSLCPKELRFQGPPIPMA
jgi:hypothetical protein